MTKAIKTTFNKINFMIDPRIELLSSIQVISNYGDCKSPITKKDFSYKRKMEDYFKPYKEHKAVKIFEKLSARGFDYDAPFDIMLNVSQPTHVNLEHEIDEINITRIDNENGTKTREDIREELEEWVKAVGDYAAESNFSQFYNENEEFYKSVIEEGIKIIGDNDLVQQIESYYGMTQNSYNFIFTSVIDNAGFGPRIECDGKYDIYSILGISGVKDDMPTFGNISLFRHMVWHEFSHSFINPLTEKHIAEVNKYEELFHPIKEAMENQAYGDWETCVNEHVIRALTSRFSAIYVSEEFGEVELTKERIRDYAYAQDIFSKLKDYENNRDKYKTFEAFYPEIINLFKELKERNLGDDFYKAFRGPICKLYRGRDIAVILPTNEEDKATEEKLSNHLRENFSRIGFKDIFTDKEALNMDLKDKNLLIYGTLEGNLWLNKYRNLFAFDVKEDGIRILEEEFKGDNLSLIITTPNPQNSHKGVNIFTAQKLEEIINLRIHPSHLYDYMIFKGEDVLEAGSYIK